MFPLQRIPRDRVLARVRASRASFLTWQSVRAAESTRLTKRGIVSMGNERAISAGRSVAATGRV